MPGAHGENSWINNTMTIRQSWQKMHTVERLLFPCNKEGNYHLSILARRTGRDRDAGWRMIAFGETRRRADVSKPALPGAIARVPHAERPLTAPPQSIDWNERVCYIFLSTHPCTVSQTAGATEAA